MKKFKKFERILVMVMIGLLAANLIVGSMTIKAADDINQSIIDPENVITGTIDDHSDDAAQPADTADISDEQVDETFADDAQDENISDANDASQDASALHALTYEDEDVLVTVEELEVGAFPENCAELSVAPVTKENPDTETQYKEVEEKLYEKAENEDYDIAGFLAYDIKIMDSEGNKLEPNGKVKVSMSYKQEPVLSEDAQETVANDATLESTADLDVTVMHLEEDEAGNVTDVVDLSKVIPEGQTEEQAENKIEKIETDENNAVSEMVFETGGFSVYTVTWTRYTRNVSGNNIVVPLGESKMDLDGSYATWNTWNSSNSSVAKVTPKNAPYAYDATVEFLAVGTTTITHINRTTGRTLDTWNVTVYDPNLNNNNIIVHYVDDKGNDISGKTGNGTTTSVKTSWTDISAEFGQTITGYDFQGAHINTLTGAAATQIRFNNGMKYRNGTGGTETAWGATNVGGTNGYHLYMVYEKNKTFTIQHIDSNTGNILETETVTIPNTWTALSSYVRTDINGYTVRTTNDAIKIGNTNAKNKQIIYGNSSSASEKKTMYREGSNGTAVDWDYSNDVVSIYYKQKNTLNPVETVDSKALGVTITMKDYSSAAQGITIGGAYGNGTVKDGLLKNTLDAEGYPLVKSNNNNSLKSLFTNGTDANHLFLQSEYDESGYLYYSCFDNYAYLNKNGDFTVYEELGTPSSSNKFYYKRGNFMPYNSISTDTIGNYNLYDGDGNDLPQSDSRYNEPIYKTKSSEWTKDDADYYFGMEMKATFAQPESGMVNGKDMIYEFNGDDDLWIYIDGVLVLDIGGIHDAHSGYINFATGKVVVYDQETDKPSTAHTHETTIKQCYKNAGVFPDGTTWNDALADNYFDGNTFKDFTTHDFKMFYMERGAGASNLVMKFNLPTIPKGDLAVSKQLDGSNEKLDPNTDFTFVLKKNGAAQAGTAYNVYNLSDWSSNPSGAIPLYSATTKTDGSFTIKPMQIAVFKDLMKPNDTTGTYTVTEDTSAYANYIQNVVINGKGQTNNTIQMGYDASIANYINFAKDQTEYKLNLTKAWKYKNGDTVSDDKIPFGKVVVGVHEYRWETENGANAEKTIRDVDLVLEPTDWSATLEHVQSYSQFRPRYEKVYDTAGNLVLQYDYTKNTATGAWSWNKTVDNTAIDQKGWEIDKFEFERNYSNTSIQLTDSAATSDITDWNLNGSELIVIKKGGNWIIFMPYMELMTATQKEDVKAKLTSAFKSAVGYDASKAVFYDDYKKTSTTNLVNSLSYKNDGTLELKFADTNWDWFAKGKITFPGYQFSASLTNTVDVADLDLKKADVEGNELTGAEFQLYKKKADGSYVAVGNAFAVDNAAQEDALKRLHAGEYKLVETKAPNGYSLLGLDILFKVTADNNGAKVEMVTTSDDLEFMAATGQTPTAVLTVKNHMLYSLPSTGGPGIFAIMFGGSLLMACAAGLVICRRRTEIVVRN